MLCEAYKKMTKYIVFKEWQTYIDGDRREGERLYLYSKNMTMILRGMFV